MESLFRPKLISIIQEGYSRNQLLQDFIAGVVVGIISLPMAIAFAIGSGARPEQGLYTAVVAGFFTAVFSGSRVQIGGPTGAFVILIANIIGQYGYDGLAVAGLIAGVILILLGVARLGTIIKFIPYPVVVGFTSGIAIVIFTGQLQDFLGLVCQSTSTHFVAKWLCYFKNISSINWYAGIVGLLAIIIIFFWSRVSTKIPGTIVALIVTTAVAQFFKLPIATIGSQYGSIAHGLPWPHIPHVQWRVLPELFSAAIAIALLAGIESLLTAVVADGMLGRRHRSNMELVAQGIANIMSMLFGGIPSVGAMARTVANIKNGGQTPFAGIFCAFFIFMAMIFLGNLMVYIPMTALSAILIMVAYNMIEWRNFSFILKGPASDVAVLLSTFLLTIFVDLQTALQAGIILAMLFFVYHMAESAKTGYAKELLVEEDDPQDPLRHILHDLPQAIDVFEIQGPLFFAATGKFQSSFERFNVFPKILILHLHHVPTIDITGLHILEGMIAKAHAEKRYLLISGVSSENMKIFKKAGFLEIIGQKNLFSTLRDAIKAGKLLLQE